MVYVRPIKDEFYDPDPSAERSSCFAQEKGLVSKAPGGPTLTPAMSETANGTDTSSLIGGQLKDEMLVDLATKSPGIQVAAS